MHVPLRNPPIHHLDDAGFVQELQWRYAGSQVDLLNDPELREVFLPVLRADIRLVETYRHSEQPLLSFPVAAVSGEDDPNVLDEGLEAWKDLVAADLRIRRFPGDHFYHVGAGEKGLLDEIAARIG